MTRSFEWIYGKMTDFGLPEPDHLIGEAHPTMSNDFAPMVKSGKIAMAKQIASANGNVIRFEDGEEKRADAIIYCTGYNISLPFFDEGHLSAPKNEISLYHRVFHPVHPRVFFVGLLQTIGAVMPVCEIQAKLIAAYLSGDYNLPAQEEMEQAISKQRLGVEKRFVASRRHTMQVIPETFRIEVRKDLRQGKKRAEQGFGRSFKGS